MAKRTAAEALLRLLDLAKPVSSCGCPCGVYEIRLLEAEVVKLWDLATREVPDLTPRG